MSGLLPKVSECSAASSQSCDKEEKSSSTPSGMDEASAINVEKEELTPFSKIVYVYASLVRSYQPEVDNLCNIRCYPRIAVSDDIQTSRDQYMYNFFQRNADYFASQLKIIHLTNVFPYLSHRLQTNRLILPGEGCFILCFKSDDPEVIKKRFIDGSIGKFSYLHFAQPDYIPESAFFSRLYTHYVKYMGEKYSDPLYSLQEK